MPPLPEETKRLLRAVYEKNPLLKKLLAAEDTRMNTALLLSVLRDLVIYCHHHEGWQDDHSTLLKTAETLLDELDVEWRNVDATKET